MEADGSAKDGFDLLVCLQMLSYASTANFTFVQHVPTTWCSTSLVRVLYNRLPEEERKCCTYYSRAVKEEAALCCTAMQCVGQCSVKGLHTTYVALRTQT